MGGDMSMHFCRVEGDAFLRKVRLLLAAAALAMLAGCRGVEGMKLVRTIQLGHVKEGTPRYIQFDEATGNLVCLVRKDNYSYRWLLSRCYTMRMQLDTYYMDPDNFYDKCGEVPFGSRPEDVFNVLVYDVRTGREIQGEVDLKDALPAFYNEWMFDSAWQAVRLKADNAMLWWRDYIFFAVRKRRGEDGGDYWNSDRAGLFPYGGISAWDVSRVFQDASAFPYYLLVGGKETVEDAFALVDLGKRKILGEFDMKWRKDGSNIRFLRISGTLDKVAVAYDANTISDRNADDTIRFYPSLEAFGNDEPVFVWRRMRGTALHPTPDYFEGSPPAFDYGFPENYDTPTIYDNICFLNSHCVYFSAERFGGLGSSHWFADFDLMEFVRDLFGGLCKFWYNSVHSYVYDFQENRIVAHWRDSVNDFGRAFGPSLKSAAIPESGGWLALLRDKKIYIYELTHDAEE